MNTLLLLLATLHEFANSPDKWSELRPKIIPNDPGTCLYFVCFKKSERRKDNATSVSVGFAAPLVV